jgi:hypothetical protein
MHNRGYFCSLNSLQLESDIFGTASRHDVWFLLEYTGQWHPQVLPKSLLPDSVKVWLHQNLHQTPHSRLLFIKRTVKSSDKFTFYVALSYELHQHLYKFELDNYLDLLSLDIPALLQQDVKYAANIQTRPLYLTCTHGKHDQCCAKFGLPLYHELARLRPVDSWQCSHIGGDRFAPNLLVLPYGLYYGRMSKEELPAVLQNDGQRIYLPRYRGRSSYNFITQAAEYFLRLETGRTELQAFRLVASVPIVRNERQMVFEESGPFSRQFQVRIVEEPSNFNFHLTCHSPGELHIPQYRLLGLSEILP